jgi:hypothetical protein
MSRDLAVAPLAGALVRAVAEEDAQRVASILNEVHDWQALAVVLAANAGKIHADFLPYLNGKRSTTSRKRTTCATCGALCRSASGLCRDCQLASPAALEDGEWVLRNGIKVWTTGGRSVA